MADNFKNIVFGLTLFVAFTWIMLTVIIDFGAEYGRSSNEIGNGSLSEVNFRASANTVEGNASSFRTAFEDGKVDNIDDPSGMFSTGTKFITLITTPFTLISSIMKNIFGVPELVLNVILGLLAIALILGLWSVLRSGN